MINKKMDKITEEVLTSLIKRIEIIEEKINSGVNPSKKEESPAKRAHWLISDAQAKLVKDLGGVADLNMKKKDAGLLIDKLISQKNSEQKIPPIPIPKDKQEEAEKAFEKLSKLVPAIIDPEVKRFSEGKLTPEELEELEKDGALL